MMVRLVVSGDFQTTINALESMFQEIGGAPRKVTTDNPKVFALEVSRYFLGQPGTGKTHLAKAGHRLDSLFKQMLSSKLWILDDWGVVSMDKEVTVEVFDLLDRRKHSSALVLTSNRAVREWPEVFPDAILASATLDRLFEQAQVMTFTGQSYRLRGRIESKLADGGLETSQKD